MKKASNTIRIGVYRRGNLSEKFKDDHAPPSNIQEQAHQQPARERSSHQPVKEQTNDQPVTEEANHPQVNEESNDQPVKEELSTEDNYGVSTKDSFDDQQLSQLTSPNNVRVHDIDETNTNQQEQINDPESDFSSASPVKPQQELKSDPNEIPIKTNFPKTKKILVGFSLAVVVGAIVIVATVLAVVLTASGNTTTAPPSSSPSSLSSSTSSTFTTTTTVPPTIISAYWSFDTSANDLYGVYNGNITNGATFAVGAFWAMPFVGYGQALFLTGASSQQVFVPSPVLPLNSTSFTIEAWIYSNTIIGDRGIFGQCQCSTCQNQCFFFICRSNRLYVGFTLNDLSGVTIMAINNWYHVAFVYNYQTQQQILYLNGVQDSVSNNSGSFRGRNGSTTIGSTQVYGTTNYFSGYIDNVMVTTRAKTASEILTDASLVVYYSFDLPNPILDNGPNHLNATANNTVTTTGRVNQALRFDGVQSNFQVYGVYQTLYGVIPGKSFSVSMWINPTTTFSSTIVQMFPASLNTATCANFLGTDSAAGGIGQLFVLSNSGGPSLITGPFVTPNTWTHVSVTYSPTDGYTLYYNGVYYGATGATAYVNTGTYAYLLIGYSTGCTIASLNGGYLGSIDELYVHSRELAQADVTALAIA